MTRDLIQAKALPLARKHPYIIFEHATSLGKSLLAIKILEEYGGEWNIVIAETLHEQNWIDDFKKHNKEHLLKQVKFFCYASMKKHLTGENYILDEIHHLSEKRLEYLSIIKRTNLKKLIGLSATIKYTLINDIRAILGTLHVDSISLSKAIDHGILPTPKVYFIGIELDDTLKKYRFEFNKEKSVLCTQKKYYELISGKVDYLKDKYMSTRQNWAKIAWLSTANKSKLFRAELKTPYAKTILKYLEGKRYICFSGSIAQTNELSNIGVIHSEIPKKNQKQTLKDFNTLKLNRLFVKGMLKEGHNLKYIEAALVIQLDNQKRMYIQTLGRSLRSTQPEFYVLYIKNTQDETYVNTVLEGFNMNYVEFKTINEFKNLIK